MSKIDREVLNQKEYLVVDLGEGEYLDEDCLAAVSSGRDPEGKAGIEGILPISYTQFEGRKLRYDINAYIPYTEYKKQIEDAEVLCRIFLSILDIYKQAESYLLDPAYFLLKQEYIYVSRENGKAWLILCPIYDEEGSAVGENGDFQGLFRSMARGIRLAEEDMAFYGNLSYELNKEEAFNVVAFRRFLTERGKRKTAADPKPATLKPDTREGKEPDISPETRKESPSGSGSYIIQDSPEKEMISSFPPIQGTTKGKSSKGGFLGGLFGGKSGKGEKNKKGKESGENGKKNQKDGGSEPEKGKSGNSRGWIGGVPLPDEEELPEGFQDKAEDPPKELGKPKDKKEKKEKEKKEKEKKEKEKKEEKEVRGWDDKKTPPGKAPYKPDIIPQTDDEIPEIPPTDDDTPDETFPRRKQLCLKRCDTGEMVHVGKFPFDIGREGSGLVIEQSMTKVSRHHVVIDETAEGFTIRDVSKLGTFIDGQKIEKEKDIPLQDGMQVLLKEVAYDVILEER